MGQQVKVAALGLGHSIYVTRGFPTRVLRRGENGGALCSSRALEGAPITPTRPPAAGLALPHTDKSLSLVAALPQEAHRTPGWPASWGKAR